MAMIASSGAGSWDKFAEPQIWIATSFKVRDTVPMNRKDWARAESAVANRVFDNSVKAIISADPNWALPQLQHDVKAAILQMGLEPDNFTFGVIRVPVEAARVWRTDLVETGRHSYWKQDVGVTERL